jgi:hypothetical protein
VVVGELRITVSERRAPRSIVAAGRLGSIRLAEALDYKRGGRPHRIERGGHRHAGFDRADVVVVEDLRDLGVLDTRHALCLLRVVDEQYAAPVRAHEIGARYQTDRASPRRGAPRGCRDRLGVIFAPNASLSSRP